MAYYRRPIKIESENSTSNLLSGKTIRPGKEVGLRRPALGDIQNHVTNRDAAKKGPIVKKPEVKTTRTASIRETNAVIQRDTKKVPTNVPAKPDVVKKPPITTKFETECKIEEVTEPKSFSSKRYDSLEEEILGNDPQFVPEYINDIFSHLRNLENKYKIDPLFLNCHKTTHRMRSILINWLVEVQVNFKLLPETLHLCVSVIDRYLQKNKSVGRENLQLVGITALWIAGKYEEMYLPEIGDFVYLCENSFSVGQMRKMEQSILLALDFSFGKPLSLQFLRRYSRVSNVQPEEHTLAKYLLELALLELELCIVKPSLLAAAAIYLSLLLLNNGASNIWSKALIHYSTYTFADLEKTVKLLADAVVKAETSKHQAIRTKYKGANHGKIALCDVLRGPVIKKLAQK